MPCHVQHLGEHHLLFGKTEPYETDIRLPMYIMGPGVPQGEIRYHPTNHLDITATIVALAGAGDHVPTSHPLDGLSFADALTDTPPTIEAWRAYSFSEFYVNDNTWWAIRHAAYEDAPARAGRRRGLAAAAAPRRWHRRETAGSTAVAG